MKRFFVAFGMLALSSSTSACEGCNKPKEAVILAPDASVIPAYVSSNSARPHITPSFHPQRVVPPPASATATAP